MARIYLSQLITWIRAARLEPRNQLFIKPALEILETRLAPSISIQLDYALDTSGFFTNHPDRESLLSTAANALASRLGDSLSAIVPNPAAGDTWNAVFIDPSTGTQTQIANLTVPANTLIIFAGGQWLGGATGIGGPGGLSASGDQAWLNLVAGRGKPGALGLAAQQTAFAPWGGSVTFDTSLASWYFGVSAAGIQFNQTDFLSVAEHELGHALGFGTSNSWTNRVLGSTFIGANSVKEFGGPVPTDAAGSAAQHWADGTRDRGMHCTMNPSFNDGERDTFTPLDFAGLADLGWTLLPPQPVDNQVGWHDVVTGDFTGNGMQDIASMTATGQWWVALSNGSSFTNKLWTTWNSAVTWVDVHVGDFNGDGKADIVGRVLQTGQWWVAQSTGSSFTNALWGNWSPAVTWVDVKAGDFNGDGKADIAGRVLQSGQWWVSLSTGSSFTNSLWATWSALVTWVDAQVGDFNGDGKADITGRWLQGGSWWTGISTGTSFRTSLWAQWNAKATWVDVRVGDFNGAVNSVTGDRIMDITARWLEGGSWWTAISTGTSFNTTFWAQWNPTVTWVDVKVGDFNGDGKDDITGRWLQGGSWWTGISTGSSFTTSLWGTWSTAVTWVDVSSAEIDGGKLADLIGRYSATGQWWAAISNGSNFTNQLWTTWAP